MSCAHETHRRVEGKSGERFGETKKLEVVTVPE